MTKMVWAKRSEEWIKLNPGQPTMYKTELTEGEEPPSNLRQEIRNAYKQQLKNKKENDAGIYVIVCEVTKHAYVGQSINMGTRMRSHKMCIINADEPKIKTYIKMREHYKAHGINVFEFKRHINIELSNSNTLIDLEIQTMKDYIGMGYTLYNSTIMGNVHCPDNLKLFIENIIAKCINDPTLIDKVKSLI